MKKSNVIKINPKKKLDILERLMLLGILPKEGTYANLKLLRVVKEALSFSDAENKKLQFKQDVGPDGQPMLFWNPNVKADKEIFFGDVVEGLIRATLTDLDKAGKITESHYSLYEKFMEGHEDKPKGE
jgi:hypothetical protein